MNLKQIKLRYFLMYFVAFLVAFMSSVLIYVAASRNLEKDAIERFNMQCELGISDVENLLYRMNYVEDIIKQNEAFKQVARIKGAVKNEDVLYLGKVRTLMSELKITTSFCHWIGSVTVQTVLHIIWKMQFCIWWEGKVPVAESICLAL